MSSGSGDDVSGRLACRACVAGKCDPHSCLGMLGFQPRVDYQPKLPYGWCSTVADFDGDLLPDVVTASSGEQARSTRRCLANRAGPLDRQRPT